MIIMIPLLMITVGPPDGRDDHEALLMIRVIPPPMIKVVRTKEPPLCFVAGSPSLLLHQVGIACLQRTKLCQRLKYTRAEQPRENVAKEVG